MKRCQSRYADRSKVRLMSCNYSVRVNPHLVLQVSVKSLIINRWRYHAFVEEDSGFHSALYKAIARCTYRSMQDNNGYETKGIAR